MPVASVASTSGVETDALRAQNGRQSFCLLRSLGEESQTVAVLTVNIMDYLRLYLFIDRQICQYAFFVGTPAVQLGVHFPQLHKVHCCGQFRHPVVQATE